MSSYTNVYHMKFQFRADYFAQRRSLTAQWVRGHIISFLSVNTIAPLIMLLEKGFSMETYKETLKILPIMRVIGWSCYLHNQLHVLL